jgi:hypothetical protein
MVEHRSHKAPVSGPSPDSPIMNAITDLDEYTLYWLAGLLEGEGSFSPGTPSEPSRIRIYLHMTDEDVIARVASIFGVGYVHERPRKDHWKPTYLTRVAGERAALLMKMIYPLMGQRRQAQIRRCLENYVSASELLGNRFRAGSKLTIDQVKAIKRRIANGETAKSIAKDFGVTHYNIWAIREGKTWKEIEPDE